MSVGSSSIIIKIRKGKFSFATGALGDIVISALERFSKIIKRGYVEIYGTIDQQALMAFFMQFPENLPECIKDIYIMIENYKARVVFYLRFLHGKLIIIFGSQLLNDPRLICMIRDILKAIKDGKNLCISFLSVGDIDSIRRLVTQCTLPNGAYLQLNADAANYVINNSKLLMKYRKFRIFSTDSPSCICIDHPTSVIDIYIGSNMDTATIMRILDKVLSFNIRGIDIIFDRPDTVTEIINLLDSSMIHDMDYVFISSDKIRILRAFSYVEILLETDRIHEKPLRDAILRSLELLTISRASQIVIRNEHRVESKTVVSN